MICVVDEVLVWGLYCTEFSVICVVDEVLAWGLYCTEFSVICAVYEVLALGLYCTEISVCYMCVVGEVPGLYSPEELEPLLSSLKDPASQDGFTGPLFNYFAYRERLIYLATHLHDITL